MKFEFEAIGYVRSPYKQRFGIPHQSGVSEGLTSVIQLNPDPDFVTALRELESFSHLWIIFVFHEHGGKKWKPSVRPPRLGGQKKVGVFASRSPHRPNPIGISAVKIDRIEVEAKGGPQIHVSNTDLLDGTPVLDIKPYLPAADSISGASSGWANIPIKKYAVSFSIDAENFLSSNATSEAAGSDLRAKIIAFLELDPRPAFQKRKYPSDKNETAKMIFGIDVLGFDVKYQVTASEIRVASIEKLKQ